MRSFFFSLFCMMRFFFFIDLNLLLWIMLWTWLRIWCIWFNIFLRGSWWLLANFHYIFYDWFRFFFFIYLDLLFFHNKAWYTVDLILKETLDILFNLGKILARLITHSCDLVINLSLKMRKNLIYSADFGINFCVNSFISFDDTAEPFVLNISHFGQLLLHDSHSSFHINISIFLFLLISSVPNKMDELVLCGFLEILESSFKKSGIAFNLHHKTTSLNTIHRNCLFKNYSEFFTNNRNE